MQAVTERNVPPPPRDICLLRLSALGDVCMTMALVYALRRAWPQTPLTWIIGKAALPLVELLPGVEFIVFEKHRGFASLRDLRYKLGGRRFDILLLPQTSERANLLSLTVRARRRIGFDRTRSRNFHGLVINERIEDAPYQHQADAFLQFARHLGIDVSGIDRRLPLDDDDWAFARKHQPEAGRSVVISPASSHADRNWTVKGYAEVADWLVRQGHPVILMGGPSEAEQNLGAAIESKMNEKVINLIGQDTLRQSLAMYERAACVIAPDSGPAHFADAMGTPVVGLYAATWSRRSGPLNSLKYTVDRYAEAAQRFARKPPEALRWGKRLHHPEVMSLITPSMVIEKLKQVLQP